MKPILINGKLDLCAGSVSGVYGIQMPDGKWLVGCSNNISSRLWKYYRGDGNKKFRSALDSCGWKAAKVYILEECENNRGTLLAKEGKWSRELNSVEDGYNVAPCGMVKWDKSFTTYDEKYRKRVSEAMKLAHAKRRKGKGAPYKGGWKWKKNLAASPSKNLVPAPIVENATEDVKLSQPQEKI